MWAPMDWTDVLSQIQPGSRLSHSARQAQAVYGTNVDTKDVLFECMTLQAQACSFQWPHATPAHHILLSQGCHCLLHVPAGVLQLCITGCDLCAGIGSAQGVFAEQLDCYNCEGRSNYY